MTEGPDLEPWLANGFPPPSFVVETERVAVGGAGPPLQNRLLVGGAILGAVLLITGLILMVRSGGGGETALNTAPDTPTSSIPVVTFPPGTVFEPSFLIPEETLPTLPPAAQTPIFPITPAPGPGPGTTQRPKTTKKPGGPPSVPDTTTTASTSTSTSTSTTTAALRPEIKRVGTASSYVEPSTPGDRCSGGLVRATVTDATFIRRVLLTVVVNDSVVSEKEMNPDNELNTRSGDWTFPLSPITTPTTVGVRLILKATNQAELSRTEEEFFRCPEGNAAISAGARATDP